MNQILPDLPLNGASRADQTAAKKQRLLQIARQQFIRDGYRAVTMDAIAQATKVSKRSLYLWHEDKAALFRACLIQGAERFPTPLFDPDGRLEDSLTMFGMSLYGEFAQSTTLDMGRLLIRESHDLPDIHADLIRSHKEYLVAPLTDYFTKIRLAGADAEDIAELFISMVLAPVHNHLLMQTPLPDEQAVEDHISRSVTVFLTGQRTRIQKSIEPASQR